MAETTTIFGYPSKMFISDVKRKELIDSGWYNIKINHDDLGGVMNSLLNTKGRICEFKMYIHLHTPIFVEALFESEDDALLFKMSMP